MRKFEKIVMKSRVNVGAMAVIVQWMNSQGVYLDDATQSEFINMAIEALADSIIDSKAVMPPNDHEQALEMMKRGGLLFKRGKARKEIVDKVNPMIRKEKDDKPSKEDYHQAAMEAIEMRKKEIEEQDNIDVARKQLNDNDETKAEGKQDGIAGMPGGD